MATMALRKRFSVDEYYRMAEAGILRDREAVELIDGDIVTMSPIGPRHAACVSSGTRALVFAAGESAIVQPQGPVRLDGFNEPQPDLLLLRPRRDFYASRHAGPNDVIVVIEVAESSLRLDRDVKAPLYAMWGVPEYWLADLPHDTLWRYRLPANGKYQKVDALGAGQPLAPALLPDCVVDAGAFLIS